MEIHDTSVEVLYDFEYSTKDGQKVNIKEGERLYLIKKTNTDWWQVIRSTGRRPFYVPSSYVREIASSTPKDFTQVHKAEDYRVTVCIKPPEQRVVRSKSNTKVFLNCSDERKRSDESLSGDDKARQGRGVSEGGGGIDSGYSTVQPRQQSCGEAIILEETMTESLADLAGQIKFSPSKGGVGLDREMARSENSMLTHSGSFKTHYERRLLKGKGKGLSESCPEVVLCPDDTSNPIIDRLQADIINFTNHRSRSEDSEAPLDAPSALARNSSDSVFSYDKCSVLEENDSIAVFKSDDSAPDKRHKPTPVAKPRKLTPQAPAKFSVVTKVEKQTETVISCKSGAPEAAIVAGEPKPSAADLSAPRKNMPVSLKPTPKDSKQEEVIYANLELIRQKKSSQSEESVEESSKERRPEEEEITKDKEKEKEKETRELREDKWCPDKEKKEKDNREKEKGEETLPSGWTRQLDPDTQQTFYTHSTSVDKWYSSEDAEGRAYYYQENSAQSSWVLPELPPSSQTTNNNISTTGTVHVADMSAIFERISSIDHSSRRTNPKALSMIVPPRKEDEIRNKNWPELNEILRKEEEIRHKNWPELNGGKMNVLHKGPVQCTKVQETGKRVKKNWNSGYAALTELFLLIYKDVKAFDSPNCSPELSVDLNGAEVWSGEKVTARKNVFVVSALIGHQVAIQCDNLASAANWIKLITQIITKLPKGNRLQQNQKLGCISETGEETKKGTSIGRSKSLMFKSKEGSVEDLGGSGGDKSKIKERLKKFFHKRPTMDQIVKKGIYKNEPVFGSSLEDTCHQGVGKEAGLAGGNPKVPLFVKKCIKCIEKTEENMKTDGLYRASGNLSQVQKIRLQIDQNNYKVLEDEEDVHVLTGALKLFFRELKEPLIPCKLFDKAIKASNNKVKKDKLHMFSDIIKALPPHNRETLKFLLQHLLRVTQHQEENRMRVANLAIVFGPTLMWPEQECSANMAVELLQQNMVIECLLLNFHHLFK